MKTRDWEIAQWVNLLLCQHGDMNPGFYHSWRKAMHSVYVCVCVCVCVCVVPVLVCTDRRTQGTIDQPTG